MRRVLVIGGVLACAALVAVLGTAASGGGGSDYKVRAIFDSAFSVIPGEDVKVAGVTVGKITALDLTPDNKAAITLDITKPGFGDWRKDATCTIRPQSLIGEKFVECQPTVPRAAGAPVPPPLPLIRDGQPGAGAHLLPVTQTSRPVDLDLVGNIMRLPYRERFSILISDFGTGLAGNGQELNQAIKRADPALQALDKVLAILASENHVLSRLAVNSDTILQPLAARRAQVADFIAQANTVAEASAQRRADIRRNLQLLPPFLTQLRPTMVRIGALSDEMTPVLQDLSSESPALTRFLLQLGPFSNAGIPALRTLGQAADIGRVALPRTLPIIRDVRALAGEARPVARNARITLTSFRDSGGIERLMDYLFFQVAAINGYDASGHYLRAGLLVNSCSAYATSPVGGCSSNFNGGAAASAASLRAALLNKYGPIARARAARLRAARAAHGKRRSGSSAPAQSAATHALKIPSDVLPGGPATGSKPGAGVANAGGGAGAGKPSQALLNYLLGAGT